MDNIIYQLNSLKDSEAKDSIINFIKGCCSGNLAEILQKGSELFNTKIRRKRLEHLDELVTICRNGDVEDQFIKSFMNPIYGEIDDILLPMILKSIDEINPIKRYILGKIIIFYFDNNNLDDIHETLFNNLNIFNRSDIENILILNKMLMNKEITKHISLGSYLYNSEIITSNPTLLNTILKLIQLQILYEHHPTGMNFGGGKPKKSRNSILFFIPPENGFNTLVKYLEEYKFL